MTYFARIFLAIMRSFHKQIIYAHKEKVVIQNVLQQYTADPLFGVQNIVISKMGIINRSMNEPIVI
jgi:hypothetical protein